MQGNGTLFFDGQFWVFVLELRDHTGLRVVRRVLGAEPGNAELWEFIRRHGHELVNEAASAPLAGDDRPLRTAEDAADGRRPTNARRAARDADRVLRDPRPSTAAQEALRQLREQGKQDRRVVTSADRRARADRLRELRRAKQREKHRGH